MNSLPITRVRPPSAWNGIDVREMWEHRDLLEALIRRDLTVRYKQTIAGVLWVLGQPILTTVTLSLLLVRLVGQSPKGTPLPLFVYVGMVPWAYFTHALTKSSTCFVEHAGLVTRVYLPRLLIPMASILAALVDFGLAFLILPILMAIYGVAPSLTLAALPLILVLMIVSTFGIGLWLASLDAEFRDISFAMPFLLQLGLFVTPIFYSSEIVPFPLRWLYALNPMAGVVEGMRWSLLNAGPPPLEVMTISIIGTLVILTSGLYVFQRREPNLADVI